MKCFSGFVARAPFSSTLVIVKLKSISAENQLKNIIVGTAGLFAGLSLKR